MDGAIGYAFLGGVKLEVGGALLTGDQGKDGAENSQEPGEFHV